MAASLVLPLFIFVDGTFVKLPDSFYSVTGIPVHSSVLLFLLLPKDFLKYRTEIIFLLVFLIYCNIALLHSSERLQTAIQLGYFIYAYKILNNLNKASLKRLCRHIAIIGYIFIIAHVISMLHPLLYGGDINTSTEIFGFVIYQSHLTYPVVLTFVLFNVYLSFTHRPILRLILIILVLFIEINLLRRVGFGLLLFYLLLFEFRIVLGFVTVTVIVALLFSEKTMDILANVPDLDRFGQIIAGAMQRSNTWQKSLDLLQEAYIFMFGNGLNNYSHNFFLHTVTTHGIIVSMVFFTIIFYYIFTTINKCGVFSKFSYFIIAIILIDWSVNVNIYQPYYSAMFAVLLVSSKYLFEKKNADG